MLLCANVFKSLVLQIFKMWNKELYVREQQDAYEFFTSLVDQLDEHLKVIHTSPVCLRCIFFALVCLLVVVADGTTPSRTENGSRADLQKHISGNLFRPEDLQRLSSPVSRPEFISHP